MKRRIFHAVCPLEIGDTVITERLKPIKDIFGRTTLAIDQRKGKVTDIAAVHYCRTGRVKFRIEFDESGVYEPLEEMRCVRVIS